VKINQYCSVCKKHLDMEVIPTDDGGDDGVIWLRCPECQGFLPKFTGGPAPTSPAAADDAETREETGTGTGPGRGDARARTADRSQPTAADETADLADAVFADADAAEDDLATAGDLEAGTGADPTGLGAPERPRGRRGRKAGPEERAGPPEPVAEYAAQLAAADPATARPYRPNASYEVGDVVHHLAYDDIGIVVAKESLPGGRRAVKVFFEQSGVVRLIEQAAGGR